MGDFARNTVESPNKSVVLLHGGFLTNAGANPATLLGNIFASVVRTGAGALTATLKPEYKGLDLTARFCQLSMGAPSDSLAILKAYDKAAGTLTLETRTAGAAADIAAAADNLVSIMLVGRHGGVPEGAVYDS